MSIHPKVIAFAFGMWYTCLPVFVVYLNKHIYVCNLLETPCAVYLFTENI